MLRETTNLFRKCRGDERGAALVLFSVMLPVLMGLVALSVDFGRYWMLNTELQDLADAKALAAARELKGTPDSVKRAKEAARAVNNDPRFAQLDLEEDDSIATYRFFREDEITAPYDERSDLQEGDEDDERAAVYVSVTTHARTMFGSFIAAVSPAAMQQETRAFATAGTLYVACELTPLRICFSPPDDFTATKGQQFILRQNGNGSGVNGDFAIVDPPNQTNGNATTVNLASPSPNFCFISANTVTPGNKVSQVSRGLNVRFNIYSNGQDGDLIRSFPPAPNITKGFSGNASKLCNPGKNDYDATRRLPRDTFPTDSWRGNADWKTAAAPVGGETALEAYITAHHNAKSIEFKQSLRDAGSRYEIYLRELGLTEATEDTLISKTATMPTTMPGGSESGYPAAQCNTNTDAHLNPKRRLIYVAIVDCSDNSGNSTPPRRTNKYAKFFMTEPVTDPPDNTTYAEFLEFITPGDGSGVLHELVQLYE
jgi:Putative Flp pilus-assembly TadE/G-like